MRPILARLESRLQADRGGAFRKVPQNRLTNWPGITSRFADWASQGLAPSRIVLPRVVLRLL